jgi:hypothetical protein
MGVLEAICVIYLRRLLPDGGARVLAAHQRLNVEVAREVCTLIMLLAVAWLAGTNTRLRFASFLFAFGIWDICYYAGLWTFSRWPSSLFTWDCLFLIPKRWYGPVLAPILISIYFVLLCCVAFHLDRCRRSTGWRSVPFILELIATAIWYWSFTKKSDQIVVSGFGGITYSWPLFIFGLCFGIAGLLVSICVNSHAELT